MEPVLEAREVVAIQERVRATRLDRSIGEYLVELAEATRSHPSIKTGCSPRGTLALFRASQACAFLKGRDFVIPEDVKQVAVPVLAHRLALDTKAKYSGVAKDDVVREILDTVPVGV